MGSTQQAPCYKFGSLIHLEPTNGSFMLLDYTPLPASDTSKFTTVIGQSNPASSYTAHLIEVLRLDRVTLHMLYLPEFSPLAELDSLTATSAIGLHNLRMFSFCTVLPVE